MYKLKYFFALFHSISCSFFNIDNSQFNRFHGNQQVNFDFIIIFGVIMIYTNLIILPFQTSISLYLVEVQGWILLKFPITMTYNSSCSLESMQKDYSNLEQQVVHLHVWMPESYLLITSVVSSPKSITSRIEIPVLSSLDLDTTSRPISESDHK